MELLLLRLVSVVETMAEFPILLQSQLTYCCMNTQLLVSVLLLLMIFGTETGGVRGLGSQLTNENSKNANTATD